MPCAINVSGHFFMAMQKLRFLIAISASNMAFLSAPNLGNFAAMAMAFSQSFWATQSFSKDSFVFILIILFMKCVP